MYDETSLGAIRPQTGGRPPDRNAGQSADASGPDGAYRIPSHQDQSKPASRRAAQDISGAASTTGLRLSELDLLNDFEIADCSKVLKHPRLFMRISRRPG